MKAPGDSDSLNALASQYKAGISMLAQTNVRRTATARFFITLVSGLFGLLTIISRPGIDASTQLWTTDFVAGFSILLSCIWFISIRSLRHTARIQRSLLSEMEEQLPYAFITRQEQLIAKGQAWLNPGKIEQYVPLVMMLPALILLLATHWKSNINSARQR